PWQTRHLLASDFAVACADTQCGCSVITKCQGTLVLSSKNDCNGGQTESFAVDDKCYQAPNDSGYQFARYTGTIASESCAGIAPSAKVTLTNAQTVCCR